MASKADAAAADRWVWGPFRDLFFGAGLSYAFMFAVMAVGGEGFRSLIPLSLIPLLSVFLGAPHFGATLLRVYERAEDRRKYSLFAVWASLGIWLAFGLATHNVLLGSILFTLYLSFGPWHYTGQNYGIALIFLRRRGIPIDAGLKRWIYASYVLSFVLTLIVVHASTGQTQYQPIWDGDTSYRLLSAQVSPPVASTALLVVGSAYLASLFVSIRILFGRAARVRDLVPYLLLTFSQALWFTIPLAVRQLGLFSFVDPLSTQHAVYTFMWVAIAHSIQYLWISSYYQKNAPGAKPISRYFAHCWLAGAALWGVPALLFAPDLLGGRTFDDGLELMVAVCVNLQHFTLDAVIWKLRDGRIAQALLRSGAPTEMPTPIGPLRQRVRPSLLAWAVGAAAAAILVVGNIQGHRFRQAMSRGDAVTAERTLELLRWVGRDSASGRMALTRAALERRDYGVALTQAERAVRLQRGPMTANNLAWILATQPRPDPSRLPEAIALAEFAVAEAPHPQSLDTLAAAYASAGRFEEAKRVAGRALSSARAGPQPGVAREIVERLALYRKGEAYRMPPKKARLGERPKP